MTIMEEQNISKSTYFAQLWNESYQLQCCIMLNLCMIASKGVRDLYEFLNAL